MARTLLEPKYVRLRRLPGDPRLFITSNGSTDAGYFAEASVSRTGDDVPVLHIELEEHPYDLFSDGTDAARYDIRTDRILLHDVQELLTRVAPTEHSYTQFLALLEKLRPWMSQAEPPACAHEDVIETPALGDTQTSGVCLWCPTPLVRLNDEWVPA